MVIHYIWSRIIYNRLYDQKIPHLQECLVKFMTVREVLYCCWIRHRSKNPLEVLERDIVNQTIKHKTVTCAAITQLKPRYNNDYRIKICELVAFHLIHTNLSLTEKTYCMILPFNSYSYLNVIEGKHAERILNVCAIACQIIKAINFYA